MRTIRHAVGPAAIVGLLAAGGAVGQTIRMAQYQAPPDAADNLDGGGLYCRLAIEAFALSGHDVTATWRPIERAFAMVQEGAADLSMGFLKTPQREHAVLSSDEPIASSPVAIFDLKCQSKTCAPVDRCVH